jgi:zinc protease
LQRITLDDVRAFYRAHYTRANLVLGLAGGYPKDFDTKLAMDFARLPAGTSDRKAFEAPAAAAGPASPS